MGKSQLPISNFMMSGRKADVIWPCTSQEMAGQYLSIANFENGRKEISFLRFNVNKKWETLLIPSFVLPPQEIPK